MNYVKPWAAVVRNFHISGEIREMAARVGSHTAMLISISIEESAKQ